MHLFGIDERSRDSIVEFLCDEEGLRASHELMNEWLDSMKSYKPAHDHLLIGPLHPAQYDYLRTVTFYVNADQLAVLCMGATYYSRPDDIPPMLAPFGSGCMQIITLFDDFHAPQAIIGATDHRCAEEPGALDARLHRDPAHVRAAVPLGRRSQELAALRVHGRSHPRPRRVAGLTGC